MKKYSVQKGFTLVEIISGVAIISLLAAIVTPNLLRARENVNEMAAQATLRTIHYAMKSYRDVNSQYPSDLTQLTSTAGAAGPAYLDESMTSGARSGYLFQIESADADTFRVKATPQDVGLTGEYIFRITEIGVIESESALTAPPASTREPSL